MHFCLAASWIVAIPAGIWVMSIFSPWAVIPEAMAMGAFCILVQDDIQELKDISEQEDMPEPEDDAVFVFPEFTGEMGADDAEANDRLPK